MTEQEERLPQYEQTRLALRRRKNNRRMLTVIGMVVALILGLIVGNSKQDTVVVHPGPQRTVQVTPAACLTALKLADEGFTLSSQGFGLVSAAFTAVADGDTAVIVETSSKIDALSTKINAVAPKYNKAKAECRAK